MKIKIVCPHCGKDLKDMKVASLAELKRVKMLIIQRHVERDCNSAKRFEK